MGRGPCFRIMEQRDKRAHSRNCPTRELDHEERDEWGHKHQVRRSVFRPFATVFSYCGALFPSRQPSEGTCREGNQGNRSNERGDALSVAHIFSPQSATRVFILDARSFVKTEFLCLESDTLLGP
ncbi:hypothetical protein NDU88_009214 [Pleurodeles waltl]|uniref:Uncharacterized protein n=1 Tax=Pleurodeles waltl TaxID=8319 RepID=A0AAV7QQW8_PLEWA|nr:hypothetical protein NDU88_009214 [Pleurodeles waltl]